MPRKPQECRYTVLELDGLRYAVLRESRLRTVCRRAGVVPRPPDEPNTPRPSLAGFEADDARLAERLIERRKATGLCQAELARRAGVRVETLNRIERGRTTPDFATVRKLVIAMKDAEAAIGAST